MGEESKASAAYQMRRQARGTQPPQKERPWLRKLIWAGVGLGGLIALLVLIYAYRAYTRVWAAGATVNADVRDVSPKISGRLVEVYVTERDRVVEGQALARLDYAELEAALAAARANEAIRESQLKEAEAYADMARARATADIESAKAGVAVAAASVARAEVNLDLRRVQVAEEVRQAEAQRDEARALLARLEKGAREEDIQVAEARLEGARARLALAELEVKQSEELVGEGIDSQYILEVRKTNLTTQQNAAREAALQLKRLRAGATAEEIEGVKQALTAREAETALAQAGHTEMGRLAGDLAIRKAELLAARARLKQAEAQDAEAELAKERIKAAEAELKRAQAEANGRTKALENTYVKPEFAGTVTRVHAKVGEYCRPGEVCMLVRDDSAGRWVDAFVPQKDAWLIRKGLRARVKVPGRWRLLWWRRYVDAEVVEISFHTQSKDGGASSP
ncbi:MAG: HlyD family secretion protein, partial [Planctomycetota bacterium]